MLTRRPSCHLCRSSLAPPFDDRRASSSSLQPDPNAYSSGGGNGQQQQQQPPPQPTFSPPPVLYHTQTPPPPPPPPAQYQQQQQQQQPYGSTYADPYAPPRQSTPGYASSASGHVGSTGGWTSPLPLLPPTGSSPSPAYGAQSQHPSFAAFPPPSNAGAHSLAHASSPPPPGSGQLGPRNRYDSHASSLASSAAALGPSTSSYSLQQQQRPAVDSWHPGGGRASFDDGDDVRLLPRTTGGSSSAYAPMPGGFDLSDPAPSHHPLYAPSVNDPNDSDDDFNAGGADGGNSASSRQMHYGPVPSRVPRRNKTVRKVELFMGHLVLDCPVPKRLLDSVRERDGNEFAVMRYTAVTCDPDMFKCVPATARETALAGLPPSVRRQSIDTLTSRDPPGPTATPSGRFSTPRRARRSSSLSLPWCARPRPPLRNVRADPPALPSLR